MAYQPFLIAPFQTGLDTDAESWMKPQDAFADIINGNINHGYIHKREGSRLLGYMAHNPTFAVTNITNANPGVVSAAGHTFVNGNPVLITNVPGMVEVNNQIYTIANVVAGVSFTIVDTTGFTAYGVGNGRATLSINDRIMGIENYINALNSKETLIFDTTRAAIYNSTTDQFDPLNDSVGGNINIMSSAETDYIWAAQWLNSAGASAGANRLYFTNGKEWDGATLDGIRYYDGNLTTTTGFRPALGGGKQLYGSKLIFSLKQRLIVLNTYELDGAVSNHPQRARWCAAQNPDNWDDITPGGGGFVDAPTGDQIISARSIQDQIIVFFTDSVWTLIPTSDPALPFVWKKINSFRACDGKMASVGFDRYAVALGQRGITATDGVETRRVDERIEDFTKEEMNVDAFSRTFGRRSYGERKTWILYAKSESDEANSALIYDDESGSWAKYEFTNSADFNVLGYGFQDKDLAAPDLIVANGYSQPDISPPEDISASGFGDETAFSFFWSGNAELFLGGDRAGTIFQLENGTTDNGTTIDFEMTSAGWNPFQEQGVEAQLGYVDLYLDTDQNTSLKIDFFKNDAEDSAAPYTTQAVDLLPDLTFIADITNIILTNGADPTQGLTITAPSHGLSTGNPIYIYGVQGMFQVNNIHPPLTVTVLNENDFTVAIDATGFGTYTGGGKLVERRFYRTKVWKRAYGGGIGYVHTIKISEDGNNTPFKISAFKPWFRKRGRRQLG